MIVFVVFSSMIILCNKELDALFRTRIRIFKRLCFFLPNKYTTGTMENFPRMAVAAGLYCNRMYIRILPISSLYMHTRLNMCT